jgi:hypothetical protein
MVTHAVPYSGVNPHPEVTQQLIEDAKTLERLQTEPGRDTPMYNPKAKLDPSRMRDISHGLSFEIFGQHLAHYGVKGQKWGVVKRVGTNVVDTINDLGDPLYGIGKSDTQITAEKRAQGQAAQKWEVIRVEKGAGDSVVMTGLGAQPKVGDRFLAETDGNPQPHTVTHVKTDDGIHTITSRPSVNVDREKLRQAGKELVIRIKKDKEYWHKFAAISTVSAAGLGTAIFAPAVLPAGVLLAAGGPTIFAHNVALGTAIATTGGRMHIHAQYTKRFKSAKAAVSHAQTDSEATVDDVMAGLTGKKLAAAEVIIGGMATGSEFKDDPEVQSGWGDMTPTERACVLYYGGIAYDVEKTMSHAEELLGAIFAEESDAEHHGIKGQKWGVRRAIDSATGRVAGSFKKKMSDTVENLKPRTDSADQINQDRIAKKLESRGAAALSNADIQAFTRRLQLQQDLQRALAAQTAQQQAKADGFIKSFIKKQGSREFNRVADKAIDVAVEKALLNAGLKTGKKGGNPDLADLLVKTSTRLQPKKK